MINTIYDYKQRFFLIQQLARRDRNRENASMFLGQLWQILNPFIHTIVLMLVFTKVFNNDDFVNYPIYIASGTIFFEFFNNGTVSCMNSLILNKQFLLKTQIEKTIFVKEKIYASIINFMYSLFIYFGLVIFFKLPFRWTFIFLIPDILLFTVFIYGVGLVLSVINVYFADVSYLYDIFTLFLFYGTAVFYSASTLPDTFQLLMSFNPIYLAITICRLSIMDGIIPPIFCWIKLMTWVGIVYFAGIYVFRRGSRNIVLNL